MTAHRTALLVVSVSVLAAHLFATSYIPMSDAELAARASVIVRARALSQEAALESVGGRDVAFTVVTLQTLESFKGSAGDTFELRVPGGRAGGAGTWIPGTPEFSAAQDVVLFLRAPEGNSAAYRLSEFGLSKFDLVTDGEGRRFAVRPVFSAESDLVVSAREHARSRHGARENSAVPIREAESFLEALRAVGRGEEMPEVLMEPGFDSGAQLLRKWVNGCGREPGRPFFSTGPCLQRWFWDEPSSFRNTVVAVGGAQTNLVDDEPNCGTDSFCHVASAVTEWTGVAQTDVHMAGPLHSTPDPAGFRVELDVVQDPYGSWNAPADCTGGIAAIGIAFMQDPSPGKSFRGDSYFPIVFSEVWVRKINCATGLRARDFGSIVIHELGHTLGLGHSDEETSMHSTTTQDDQNNAVMLSSRPLWEPLAPQTDDIQAIQYYYGTQAPGPSPVADFTFSPAAPIAGAPVHFTDGSTAAPIAWHWEFGDPNGGGAIVRDRNPTITFLAPGDYAVKLQAANGSGTGTAVRQVSVASAAGIPCVADALSLCLNGGRFRVVAGWEKADGSTGQATAVPLTSDSGYFWFFHPTNVEVVAKVVNGCVDPFNSYWVFAAGLTNVGVQMAVTDTRNGVVKLYSNPRGTAFQPIQDTAAFAACP